MKRAAKGAFTITVVLGGKSYRLRGAFDEDEKLFTLPSKDKFCTRSATRRGQPYDRREHLRGWGACGGAVGTSNPSGLCGQKPVSPGREIYALAPGGCVAHPEATHPQGTGYGVLTVAPTGLTKFTSRLGDLTSVVGAALSSEGRLPIYLAMYAAKGSLSGWLNVSEGGWKHVGGFLNGRNPRPRRQAWYPAEFSGEIPVLGWIPHCDADASAGVSGWRGDLRHHWRQCVREPAGEESYHRRSE